MLETRDRQTEERYRNRWYGKYRAFVRDHNDPERLGRVRLEIPAVLGTGRDNWSDLAEPGEGATVDEDGEQVGGRQGGFFSLLGCGAPRGHEAEKGENDGQGQQSFDLHGLLHSVAYISWPAVRRRNRI